MNKNEALKRLTALESEAAALRKIIEAPEPAPSLLTKPVPGSGRKYWTLDGSADGRMRSINWEARMRDPDIYAAGNIFIDKATAEAYAEAIDTLLLLRHQPGTVPASDEPQWQLEVDDSGPGTLVQVKAERRVVGLYKMDKISPCFESREAAQAAMDAVGADRILRMFKAFHHVKG